MVLVLLFDSVIIKIIRINLNYSTQEPYMQYYFYNFLIIAIIIHAGFVKPIQCSFYTCISFNNSGT